MHKQKKTMKRKLFFTVSFIGLLLITFIFHNTSRATVCHNTPQIDIKEKIETNSKSNMVKNLRL